MKNLIDYREDAREMVKQLYKDETGKPIILTDGQCDIFNIIFKRFTPRNHIATFTRYGKSLVTALAILTRVSTFPEKFALVAGNDDQARIIMSYVIQHIFDNEYTKTRFLVGKGESEENIRRYKNKDRLNFVIERGKGEKMLLGELFITNAQGALGFGSPNVVMDESALVPDQDEALVFRMLGDQKDNFYVKIGNPWDTLHFRKSFEDPNYF